MDLILSSNPTLIFAGDLARVAGRNWLLLGHSELSATLQSIGGEFRDVLAQGGVGISAGMQGEQPCLLGRYDRGALIPPEADSVQVHAWHPIDVLAYCLDRETTSRLFGNEHLEMRRTRASVLGRMTMQDAYAGTWAQALLSAEDYAQASNPRRRFRFLERVEASLPALPCFILPFQGYGNAALVNLQPATRGAAPSG